MIFSFIMFMKRGRSTCISIECNFELFVYFLPTLIFLFIMFMKRNFELLFTCFVLCHLGNEMRVYFVTFGIYLNTDQKSSWGK